MIDVRENPDLFSLPSVTIEPVEDSRYLGRVVSTVEEFESALQLRRDVFHIELGRSETADVYKDFDEFDRRCVHLLISERETGNAVGAYRLNPYRGSISDFYASNEFRLHSVPPHVVEKAVELGRACIARDHRNSRVLFLLWRLLANFMSATGSRYLFGCCSVFTQDAQEAADVLAKLQLDGHVDDPFEILPNPEFEILDPKLVGDPERAEIPALVNIYMRIGAKVIGEPAIDRKFKTVDYFVMFDLDEINRKYRKMFFWRLNYLQKK